jgi:FkbM family methyltransferase
MRSPLSKTKIRLYKILPKSVFNLVYRVWSVYARYKNNKINSGFNQNFKQRQVFILNQLGVPFPIVVDPKNGALDMTILSYHEYEPNIATIIKRFVKKGDTVIDVGANIGVHSLYLAKISKSVHAFEPVTHFRKQFKESIKIGKVKNIKVYPCALGERNETKKIYTSKTNGAISSFMVNDDPQSTEIVKIKTLDSFKLKPSFIKIDVEGFEGEVIEGGIQTITKHRPVILFEFSPLFYRNLGFGNGRHILQLLKIIGYQMFDIEDDNKEITDIDSFLEEFEPNLRGQTNLYCCYRKIK